MSIENFIWYEKHRPKTVKALSLPPAYSAAFNSYIEEGQIPHILLVGQAGSGKTTIGKIIMDSIPCTRLELNASSKERGIDTVKGMIKDFAASQPRKGELKICFLDEADGLTADALDALKGTMEKYSKNCRFILTANNIDKITPPIRSRCTVFTFDQFSKEKLVVLCNRILSKESITVKSEKDVTAVVEKYYPDVRSTINNMQLACHSGTLELSVLVGLKVDPTKIGEFIKRGIYFPCAPTLPMSPTTLRSTGGYTIHSLLRTEIMNRKVKW